VAERLAAAGIDADVAGEPEAGEIAIRLEEDDAAAVERATTLATRRAVVEIYDLEGSLVGPSLADGQVLAYRRLYELIVGRQSPARADDVEEWYLFDTKGDVRGGPAPTRDLLTPGGEPPLGWRALGVPPGAVVLRCGVGADVCPGVGVENPSTDAYYLAEAEPALRGKDVLPGSPRQERDPLTGEPIVVLGFTKEGAARFTRLTASVADRGRRLSDRVQDPFESFQHVAVVVDGRIASWPTIDWQQYPHGIDGANGLQIAGIGSVAEARALALALRTGELPVELEVVSEPPRSG
jgi:hypothetical protein